MVFSAAAPRPKLARICVQSFASWMNVDLFICSGTKTVSPGSAGRPARLEPKPSQPLLDWRALTTVSAFYGDLE